MKKLMIIAVALLVPSSALLAQWDLINEDFEAGDVGDLMKIEHTGAGRTVEIKDGKVILVRANAGADIGPTLRAYFDDPKQSEFLAYAKVDVKKLSDDAHFIFCMRINGFEYFPTFESGLIGDHETPDQNTNGKRTLEVEAETLGPHEYLIVGKSQDAYDFYYDGQLLFEDGVTRSMGASDWEVAQAMFHLRAGVEIELHVDEIKVKTGIDDLVNFLAVEPRGKLPLTWAEIKE